MKAKLLLFSLISVLAVFLGVITFNAKQALWITQHLGYYWVAGGVVLWAVSLFQSLRAGEWNYLKSFPRNEKVWLACAAVGCVLVYFVHEPRGYKVVNDEPVLVSTSRQMHEERQASMAMRIYDLGTGRQSLTLTVDKRPLLFPFVVSVLHDLTGYRLENAFIINFLSQLGVLLLSYLIAREVAGHWGGMMAILLWSSLPLLGQQAAGAGFDVFNLLLILACMLLSVRYARRPSNTLLNLLLLTTALLLQVRYESTLFFFAVVALVGVIAYKEKILRLPWGVFWCPLILVIVPMQLLNKWSEGSDSWQLSDKPQAGTPFAFHFMYDNVGHALNFYLNFDGRQANSPLLAIAGYIGIGFLVLLFYRKYRDWWTRDVRLLAFNGFLLASFAHFLLMMAYFWGQFDDPLVQRLSLPSHLILVFAPIFVLGSFRVNGSKKWIRWACLPVVLFCVGFTLPRVANHRYDYKNLAACSQNYVDDFIRRNPCDAQTLAIDDSGALAWLVREIPSISISQAKKRRSEIKWHFDRGSFDRIYVDQGMVRNLETGQWEVSDKSILDSGFKLKFLEQRQLNALYARRISLLVGLDDRPVAKTEVNEAQTETGPIRSKTDQPGVGGFLEEWARKLP